MSDAERAELPQYGRFGLQGKVALVTGAAGGLGSAISIGLAEHGADVVVTDIDVSAAQSLADKIHSLGRKTLVVQLDITNHDQIKDAVRRTVEHFGHIEILVNVACAAKLTPLDRMTVEEFNKTINSCLTGAFLITQAAGCAMLDQGEGGSIIHVSSISSSCALGRGTGAYAASKAGVNALVRELAVEWGPRGVRVNAVAPCQFKTPSLMRVLQDPALGGENELREKMLSQIPVGHFGEPEDLVGPCVFLASDASRMVVGHILYVDGGYTAK